MWQRRPVETLVSHRPFFMGSPFGNQIEAIHLGNAPGQVWETPDAFYVWDGRYSHYLSVAETSAVLDLIEREILPAAREARIDLAKFYLLGEARCPLAGELGRRVRLEARRAVSIPAGSGDILPITADTLQEFSEIREEVAGMWGGEVPFLRSGFGFYVRLAGRCATWCTAEYLTGDTCAVGVATDPNLRHQGFATRAAAALVNHAVAKGIRVYWDAWERNEASLALARRLGFEDRRNYAIVLCPLPYGEAV